MVYGCGCEGRQDENSDYTCAEYVALSLLIIFECVSYCLFYSTFLFTEMYTTNIIISNNVYIRIVCCCALLNFESFIHCRFLSSFHFLKFYLICSCFVVVLFHLVCSFKSNNLMKYLA